MSDSREIENKLKTHKDLKDIVNAMKAFSGLNIRKTAESLESIRQYEQGIKDAIGNLVFYYPEAGAVLKSGNKRILVIFGSDLGLCGSFNDHIAEYIATVKESNDDIFVIGRILREKLDAMNIGYVDFQQSVATVEGIRTAMLETSSKITGLYSEGESAGLVYIFSCMSEKTETPEFIFEKILPPGTDLYSETFSDRPLLYLRPEFIFNELLGEFLYISLYRCYIESIRAENWYRFKSMERAMENVETKIKDLNALYRYSRQEEITQEIIEIIQSHSLV
jgi:F-type H+-transporting ATPase subunit gamma